jgi:hypothetical protein
MADARTKAPLARISKALTGILRPKFREVSERLAKMDRLVLRYISLKDAAKIRILHTACGSGSFLLDWYHRFRHGRPDRGLT